MPQSEHSQLELDEKESSDENYQFDSGQKQPASEPQYATQNDRPSTDCSFRDDDCLSTLRSTTQKARKKRNNTSPEETNDVLLEFLQRKRPNPINFLPPKPSEKDALQHFFDSIASTMRNFPPLSIAKIKLQIANIVGAEEVACAERNEAANGSVNIKYVQGPVQQTDFKIERVESIADTHS